MPFLKASTEPQKVASMTRLHWLVVQVLSGTIRMGKLDQDLKNGGGFLLVASVSYNAYWVGDLWIQGTADAAFHYEAHSTSVA